MFNTLLLFRIETGCAIFLSFFIGLLVVWPFFYKIYGFWYGFMVFIGVEIPLAIVVGSFIYIPGTTSAIQAAKILKFSSLMGLIAIYLGFQL